MQKACIKTQIVGIVNCTPDSYYERGRFTDPEKAVKHGLQLLKEGADIIDIGGESTRPTFSETISVQEELRRVLPVIKGIRKMSTAPISIDTFKPEVATAALEAGATLINDITGFSNPRMQHIAAESQARICVMHMLGAPHTNPEPYYPRGVITEICEFFKKRIEKLLDVGVNASQIILDPGIGGGSFGKTPQQNLEILANLSYFQNLEFPLLLGISRKSFMQKILHKSAAELLSTTVALNTMAAAEGVDYIRVHDVQAHRDVLDILEPLAKIRSREHIHSVC